LQPEKCQKFAKLHSGYRYDIQTVAKFYFSFSLFIPLKIRNRNSETKIIQSMNGKRLRYPVCCR